MGVTVAIAAPVALAIVAVVSSWLTRRSIERRERQDASYTAARWPRRLPPPDQDIDVP